MTPHNSMCPHLIGSLRLYRLTPGKYTVYIVTSLRTSEREAHTRKQNIIFFPFKLISIIAVYNNIEQLLIAQILKSFLFFLALTVKTRFWKNIKFFFQWIIFLSNKTQFSLALRQIILFAQVLERRIFFSRNFFSSADN